MTAPPGAPIRVNGWAVFMHPMFLAQVEDLLEHVDALRTMDPTGYGSRDAAKRLAAIAKLVFEVIPQDPAAAVFRQGDTLGAHHKHWFRAKFFQQYRLFFRYDARARVIIYAWVRGTALLAESNTAGDRSRAFVRQLDTLSSKGRG
ncbi:MAG: type II toxin-antitoxin system YhaV family toxin [Steroidobacteraceae bacterium]